MPVLVLHRHILVSTPTTRGGWLESPLAQARLFFWFGLGEFILPSTEVTSSDRRSTLGLWGRPGGHGCRCPVPP